MRRRSDASKRELRSALAAAAEAHPGKWPAWGSWREPDKKAARRTVFPANRRVGETRPALSSLVGARAECLPGRRGRARAGPAHPRHRHDADLPRPHCRDPAADEHAVMVLAAPAGMGPGRSRSGRTSPSARCRRLRPDAIRWSASGSGSGTAFSPCASGKAATHSWLRATGTPQRGHGSRCPGNAFGAVISYQRPLIGTHAPIRAGRWS